MDVSQSVLISGLLSKVLVVGLLVLTDLFREVLDLKKQQVVLVLQHLDLSHHFVELNLNVLL